MSSKNDNETQRVDRLEAALGRLAEAQAATQAALGQLTAAQARTDGRLERIETTLEHLATAQTQAEQRLTRVEAAIAHLTAAQARAEERLARLETAIEHLTAAQARAEERLARLEEAQLRTEERLARLEEAQLRTEERLARLEEAQLRTEERLARLETAIEHLTAALSKLTLAQERLAKQVGGLSESLGGDIEDLAYMILFHALREHLGWKVGELARTWVRWNGEHIELDLLGQATDPTHPESVIWIVVEAKHNFTLREVESFARKVKLARRNLLPQLFPVCFCYRARPEVEQRVRAESLNLVYANGRMFTADGRVFPRAW
jgi:tetratricopeptide (TPR) repeat protein